MRPAPDAQVPTLLPALLAALLLAPAAATPAAAAAAPPALDWIVLVRDDRLDATHAGTAAPPASDPRADLLEVSVAEEPTTLHVRLQTRAGEDPALPLHDETVETVVGFTLQRAFGGAPHAVRLEARDAELLVVLDGQVTLILPLDRDAGHAPWGYEARLSRWDLLPDGPLEIGDEIVEPWATTRGRALPPFGAATDRAPSVGYGATHALALPSGLATPLPAWAAATTVDYAAGPSLAVDAQGRGHVAYVLYRAEGGAAKGLYHATFDATRVTTGAPASWRATRVADATMPTELHEDDRTQTAIAVDGQGTPHVLYHPAPHSGRGEIRYATPSGGAWRIENPARVGDGAALPVDDSHRGVPSLVAGGGRVVAAFQSGPDAVIVEREGPDAWRLLTTLRDARFPRLALDPQEGVHVAWLGSPDQQHEVHVGTLRHATEAQGWQARDVAQGIQDYSAFWETSETDGSFAFALDHVGTPHFVWESTREERRFAILRGDALEVEPTPLEPSHGNPQVRMRMVVDREWYAHVVSGYGGADLYGVRSPKGEWARQEAVPQRMAQLALTPDGRVVTAYTQPHGGTTLAFLAQTARVGAMDSIDAQGAAMPEDASRDRSFALLVLAALGGGLGAWTLWWGFLRRVGDASPAWLWRLFAAMGLYTRLARSRLAEHETREAILRAARDEPGVSTADLRARLGRSRSAFFYHVRTLERQGMVCLRPRGIDLLLYLPGQGRQEGAPLPAGSRDLVAAVLASPGGTAADYAQALGVPRRTVSHRLRTLEREGRLAREPGLRHPARWRAP